MDGIVLDSHLRRNYSASNEMGSVCRWRVQAADWVPTPFARSYGSLVLALSLLALRRRHGRRSNVRSAPPI